MKTKAAKQDYFIGLDLGTNSVGWAVTDTDYNLLKANRKYLWGVRLFDTANTAAERRLYRAARRRNQRKVQRLNLLREIFEQEIIKIDKDFFARLKESSYHKEDRFNHFAYPIFDDKNFTDIDYYKKYPTIFHLRSNLVHHSNKNVEIRELFLAIHSILKTRGHFLFSGETLDNSSSLADLLDGLKTAILECFNINLTIDTSLEEIGKTLKLKRKTEKKELLKNYFIFSSDDEELEHSSFFNDLTNEIYIAIASSYFRVSKLFNKEEYSEFSHDKVEFDSDKYETRKDELEILLTEEHYRLIEIFEGIYNWSLLSDVLGDHEFISDAKVTDYEKHKKDLRNLKNLVRKYESREFSKAFKAFNVEGNYVHYIGKGSKNGELEKSPYKSKCSQEDINKFFLKLLKPHANDEDKILKSIIESLESKTLLPKLRVKDNRVIPHQLNLKELKIILENYKDKFPFLTVTDEEGYTPIEKITSMVKFRIPYYVGPLNTAHMKESGEEGFAWMVRQEGKSGKIYPWNFDKVVDLKASAEKFIRRMTNKCTYLTSADVVPKNSLLYNKYMVLNELNNLKINHEPISVSLKQQIFENLFLKSKTKISLNRLKSFLVTNNIIDKNEDVNFSGIDNGFTNSLTSWIDFASFLNDKILSISDIEKIIEWKALYGEDDSILISKIKDDFGNQLDENHIKNIVRIVRNYKGWGRFSRQFLEEIYHENPSTGELESIISMMWKTNENLMELLSRKYNFMDEIGRINSQNIITGSFNYESIVKPLNLSPAVKRPIWQTLIIVKELKKIMRGAPKKIFIEMAREKTNTGRTKSRKDSLKELYVKCKNDEVFNEALLSTIENKTDAELRDNRLYLYYTQLGKCLYSGKPINLADVYNNKLYDIDHIYPQSLIKDDSLNNTVLVDANYNTAKKNDYPIRGEWQEKMAPFWKVLVSKGFISKEKHYRLTRRTSLTNDELSSFINRQLVETRQSSLQVAKLLENMLEKDNTKIVYVKANNVSNFRNDFDIPKSRIINDHHHAHDAYLNIVVGNVYNTKFTNDAKNFFYKNYKQDYNIRKLFYRDIVRNNQLAWVADAFIDINDRSKKEDRLNETGTIKTIRKTFLNNQVLVTRKPITGSGALFDLQPLKKRKNLIPIKGTNPILTDTEKYGGFDKKSTGYFFIVEHLVKNKRVKQILTVPIMMVETIRRSQDGLLDYCKNDLKLENPKIIINVLHLYEVIKVDNFEMSLRGIMGNQIVATGTHQLVIPQKQYDYFAKIEKFISITTKNKINVVNEYIKILAKRFSISKEENQDIYLLFFEKEKNTIYSLRPANQAKLLENKFDKFRDLNILDQCKILVQIANLFTCNPVNADLTAIEGGKSVGRVAITNNIKPETRIELLRSSPTGVFTKEVRIN